MSQSMITNSQKHINAILLAAGPGIRMVPINTFVAKPLLEINGEKLIDRLIKQLNEAGITDISVVIGYKKESFEYLKDIGIKLIYNKDYIVKNNLFSLSLASDQILNTFVVPCDIWCKTNPFIHEKCTSWYMVTDQIQRNTEVTINRDNKLVRTSGHRYLKGNKMIGISYLTGKEASVVRNRIDFLSKEPLCNECFWEEALYFNNKMIVQPKIVSKDDVFEINTYEQLRNLDPASEHLKSAPLSFIAEQFGCKTKDIVDINVIKKGMTNRSFLFSVNNRKYVMRVPEESTKELINRKQEEAVYRTISGLRICEDPICFNAITGYKITRFIEDVRCCDPGNNKDVRACMNKLKRFHSLNLVVSHTFDLYERIDYYESLWGRQQSVYTDYKKTKDNVFKLKPFIDKHKCSYQLTHIDAIADNFLFDPHASGELALQLTDWEYAGMQDKHVDIAMFCIYSCFNKRKIDRTIDYYFGDEKCSKATKAKIYCYRATCGLLWSNWCEYKQSQGIEFADYSWNQYQYAKRYYRYASKLIRELEEKI